MPTVSSAFNTRFATTLTRSALCIDQSVSRIPPRPEVPVGMSCLELPGMRSWCSVRLARRCRCDEFENWAFVYSEVDLIAELVGFLVGERAAEWSDDDADKCVHVSGLGAETIPGRDRQHVVGRSGRDGDCLDVVDPVGE